MKIVLVEQDDRDSQPLFGSVNYLSDEIEQEVRIYLPPGVRIPAKKRPVMGFQTQRIDNGRS